MRIYVNGRNIEITDAIKAYAKEKIGKVATHYDQITGIDVVLSVIKNPSVAENHTALKKQREMGAWWSLSIKVQGEGLF